VNHFRRRAGELFCEEVPLARIAREVGTPTYVYSSATLRRHARVFQQALRGLEFLACYAVKAAPNLALLALLREEGFGFDIVSGGELFRVLRAGAEPAKGSAATSWRRPSRPASYSSIARARRSSSSWPRWRAGCGASPRWRFE
jgi:diaminopimelate decarboxylase